jgi:hypothetical protein
MGKRTMRRLAGWSLLLLLILPWVQPACAAAAVPELWNGSRTITDAVEFGENVSLEIAAGANLTFDVPATLPADLENNRPSLTLKGGLLVNGTAGCRTAFSAAEDVEEAFMSSAYLYIVGNGLPGQFFVRNCTFRTMLVVVGDAAGEFSDCLFLDSNLSLSNSPARVRNCTFLDSTVRVWTDSSENVTTVEMCTFECDLSHPESADAAVYGYGNVRIEDCRFNNFFWPIYSTIGSLEVAGCHISGAYGLAGIFLAGGSPGSRPSSPVIRDTVVEICDGSCIYVAETASISNCTLTGSKCGLTAGDYEGDSPFVVSVEGNRIFNNSDFGILTGPGDVVQILGLDNNTFDDGHGLTNGRGRMQCLTVVHVEVVDQWGSRLLNVSFCWTDALGDLAAVSGYGSIGFVCTDYQIDNAGVRRDHFPGTLTAEKDGMTCRTVVNRPGEVTRLVISIPPRGDITILNVTTVPVHPRPDNLLRFNISVNGTGDWMRLGALIILDGTEHPQTWVFDPGNGNGSFFTDWQMLGAGRHRVVVRLDPQNEVHETNEDNNNMTRDFVLAPPSAPPARFNAPLAAFSALILLLLMVVVLSAVKGGNRDLEPPQKSRK